MLHEIWQFLGANSGKIWSAVAVLYFSATTALPEKRADFDWYTYLRTVSIAVLPVYKKPQTKENV